LQDDQVIQRIVDVIAPQAGQQLIEIGPGQGALTFPVLRKCLHLEVVELDRDLIPILKDRAKAFGSLNIHQADALEFDFSSLAKDGEAIRVIGNLPYNISTPLLFHLLEYAACISDMHFMLQKEVVDRLAADISSSDYGRLSIMVQYHCKVTALFDVPPDAFYPPPKVDSSIVRLIPYHPVPHLVKNYKLFAALVKQAFSQRRKVLRNCLKNMVTAEQWEQVGISSGLRPEELTVADYVKLSNFLEESS
jgi:16S rRNA (adenine1518-N6/adenine1519-N6)-dimethyltransferase